MDLWVAGAGTDVIVGIELFGGTNGIWGGTLGREAAAGEGCITGGQNTTAGNSGCGGVCAGAAGVRARPGASTGAARRAAGHPTLLAAVGENDRDHGEGGASGESRFRAAWCWC